jgi:protein dithiol oxidoreductase (disulfide-forming)
MRRARPLTARLASGLLLASGLILAATATAQDFDISGRYEVINPPQPTETPGKIEILDVFWYGCPHCYRLLPLLEELERIQPDYVQMRRLPAIFRESWDVHARAYYAALALGRGEELHRPIFEAIHVDGNALESREAVREVFTSHGVDGPKFDDAWESFGVDSQVRKSLVMQGRYGVRGTPTIIVNGKYRVSGTQAGSYENMIRVTLALVEKEREAHLANQ